MVLREERVITGTDEAGNMSVFKQVGLSTACIMLHVLVRILLVRRTPHIAPLELDTNFLFRSLGPEPDSASYEFWWPGDICFLRVPMVKTR